MQLCILITLWITGIIHPGQQASHDNVVATTRQATAIPAKLLAFTGKADGTANILQWHTTSEVSVREFIIERCADGESFELFAWITPRGGFNAAALYRYSDSTAVNNTTYYRLRMVDTDGKEEISRIISINKKAAK